MHDDEELTFDHKGHSVNIQLSEKSNGRWSWAYTVGTKYFSGEDRALPSRQLAINDARMHAEWTISQF